jgi:hypothetical protein
LSRSFLPSSSSYLPSVPSSPAKLPSSPADKPRCLPLIPAPSAWFSLKLVTVNVWGIPPLINLTSTSFALDALEQKRQGPMISLRLCVSSRFLRYPLCLSVCCENGLLRTINK